MADRVRLVSHVLRRLRKAEAESLPGLIPTEEVAELRARAKRMHALGPLYAKVRLSRYVTFEGVTGVLERSGGNCVATDV